MMAMQLSEAARVLNARQVGADAYFAGVSTDTRKLEKDNLFVALKGPNFDGHDYVDQAARQGAAAMTVSKDVASTLPLIKVSDTRIALGQLAAHWRSQFDYPVVAVTGSNGKTTVREMIAAILAQRGPVLATQGNLNNEIGVPLTLARLSQQHRGAVIEMGANHAGEIAYLTALAKPGVAVITNAGPAHLEGFGSIENVANAKGEILSGLPADGVAIINADDVFAGTWRALAQPRRVIEFGLTSDADVRATWQPRSEGSQLRISAGGESAGLTLPLPGKHNVMNALAAAAAGIALGVGLADITAGLASVSGVQGRLQVRVRADGLCIIDDTYNANPASLTAALEVLAGMEGERWLVLGDMAELGEDAEALHRGVAKTAKQAGVARLYGLGELGASAADAFGPGGTAFSSREQLQQELASLSGPGITMLVKGSRRMGMEHVVQALLDRNGTAGISQQDVRPC